MRFNLQTATREELAAEYQQVVVERDELERQVRWFRQQYFGRKSEKLLRQDPTQATLFAVPETPPLESTSVKSYERQARKNPTEVGDEKSLRFDPSVPVDEEVLYPKEVEGLPAEAFEVIGQKVTERLVQLPVQYRVKRTIRKTVKLNGFLHTAPAPDSIIERSFADVTLLASLVTDKFQYHLPLYRQHQRMKAAGVHVSRGHLTRLVHRTLELLEPVYYALLSGITTGETVSMDETPVKASRKEQGGMKTAYFWPVCGGGEVVFVYSPTRAHDVVRRILGSGCKKLLSDGYAAYERYAESRPELVHAQCWAHVRRKFFEAKEHSPPESGKALEFIGKLFEVEARVSTSSPEEIGPAREKESAPVVELFFSYLDSLWFEQMVDKTSLLGEAVRYAKEREAQLRQFLFHPDVAISNNHVERAIRPVALGRKNWLFCWTEVGAKYAAIAYSLVECCKMCGIDPWTYLVDVLQRLDTHPANRVQELTPKSWKDLTDSPRKNAA